MPSILGLFLISLFSKKRWRSVLFGCFSILALITIIQTGCRGAYIGLFFAGIAFLALFFTNFKTYLQKYNYNCIFKN